MGGGSGGLGTSGNTSNVQTNTASQTGPYGPTVPYINNAINNQNAYAQTGNYLYNQLTTGGSPLNSAINTGSAGLSSLFNPLNAASQGLVSAGNNMINTQGDPYGILGNIQNSIGNINNPAASPGMQGVLNTIQQDTENAVNSQFAGAGRSLSGLNTQALARGLAQGEAQPLLNQYNQNISNLMGINQARTQGIGTGGQLAQSAPGLATAAPSALSQFQQQQYSMPMQVTGAAENLLLPMAGLGGTATGTQGTVGQGTQTASPLSQLGSGIGILGGLGGLLGAFL